MRGGARSDGMLVSPISILAVLGAAAAGAALTDLRWERRVLLVSAPAAEDAAVATQRRMFAAVVAGSDDRDLVLVEVIGDRVRGASDPANRLRRDYRLPANRFEAVLVGKDGGVKRRSTKPLTAADLIATIDAMPMRRAGER